MKISRLALVPAALLFVGFGSGVAGASGSYPSSPPAGAAQRPSGVVSNTSSSTPAYAIHAWQDYCTGGGTYCELKSMTSIYPADYYAGDNYSELDAYGMPGQLSGAPSSFYAECDHEYSSNGVLTYDWTYVDTYPTRSSYWYMNRTFSQMGSAGIVGDPTENSVATIGMANLTGTESFLYRLYQGYYGGQYHYTWVPWTTNVSVSGSNVDNNVTDKSVGGPGYALSFSGSIFRQTWNPATNRWSNEIVTTGTMSCTAGGTYANVLVDAGIEPSRWAYAEAEYESSAP